LVVVLVVELATLAAGEPVDYCKESQT